MDPQQIDRLKALWKSGRDKYRSFFAVLNEVRKEIGDEALPHWCFDNLRIGLSVILDYAKLLGSDDEKIAKAEFARAKLAEKRQRELEKAAHAAAVAKIRTEKRENITSGRTAADYEAEIAALKKQLAERAIPQGGFQRTCAVCRKPFIAQRPEAKTCSVRCRVALHRKG